MEVIDARASILLKTWPQKKLWIALKARKTIPMGWQARRMQGYVVITSRRMECFGNISPEWIENFMATLALIAEKKQE